jgi:uncharacterized membrane protein YfhO
MEFYSSIRNSEIISFAGKKVELEVSMLSEISQSPKDKDLMFSLLYVESRTTRNMKWKGEKEGGSKGSRKKSSRGAEYDQNTLYTYMELS